MAKSSIEMAKTTFNMFSDPFQDFQVIRFLGYASQGGATVGEVLRILGGVQDGDIESWYTAWSAFGDYLMEEGARLERQPGGRVDARRCYLRASNYHHASEQFLDHFDERRHTAYAKISGSFKKVSELSDPPYEYHEYECDGVRLPLYFLPGSDTPERYPTVMLMGGGDLVCEENFFFCGATLLERGYNVVLFELPGQGASLAMNEVSKFRPDAEVPFGLALDTVCSLPGVDPERVWCFCYSLAGYFGPRAAAFERRVKGWVFDASLHDMSELPKSVAGVGPMLANGATYEEIDAHIAAISHIPAVQYGFHWWGRRGGDHTAPIQRYSQMIEDMKPFVVTDEMIGSIQGPVLVVCGAGEPESWQRLTHELYAALKAEDKRLVLLGPETGADSHTSVASFPTAEAVFMPWLHEHAGPGAAPNGRVGRP
jgi:pimeloyl-ACP methyl ester carboxylesterase